MMTSNALLKAKYGSYAIGEERLFAFAPSDPRWIIRDGSVISKANYPALFAVYYCGDALNATADFGYRCTDPANPSTTRDVAGHYVVLENADGRFDRAIVPGGVRAFWSYEADAMQRITGGAGSFSDTAVGDLSSGAMYIENVGQSAEAGTTARSSFNVRFDSAASPGARTADETRPKNAAKWPGIFTGVAA